MIEDKATLIGRERAEAERDDEKESTCPRAEKKVLVKGGLRRVGIVVASGYVLPNFSFSHEDRSRRKIVRSPVHSTLGTVPRNFLIARRRNEVKGERWNDEPEDAERTSRQKKNLYIKISKTKQLDFDAQVQQAGRFNGKFRGS